MEWRRHWTGRLMAEHATSRCVWFVTLTYGGGYDDPAAYVLDKRHVSDWAKSLRNDGHVFRHVSVGEFGSEKGRAHWHVVIFWKSEPPSVTMDEQITWVGKTPTGKDKVIWPYGVVQIEYPRSDEACVSYILKYLDKEKGQRGEFTFPQRPALGREYLMEWARRKARAGLALFPTGQPIYQVDGNSKTSGKTAGKLYDYWLDPKSVLYEEMIVEYVREHCKARGKRILPYDLLVHLWAEDLKWADRDQLPSDVARQWLSVIWKCIRLRLASEESLKFEGLETVEDFFLVSDPKRGVSEIWFMDEETGEITWRATVSAGVDGGEKAAKARLARFHKGIGLPENPYVGASQEKAFREPLVWPVTGATYRKELTERLRRSLPSRGEGSAKVYFTPKAAVFDRIEKTIRKRERDALTKPPPLAR